MKVNELLLLLFVVGCRGVQWKSINDFKETFKEFSESAIQTISSIENILDTSIKQSELFLNNTYSNNPAVKRVAGLRLSDDKCFANFIDEKNLKFSFQIQMYQLQIPLHSRAVDIRERLNNINFSISMYEGLAESKFQSCRPLNGICLEETKHWLESAIDSLSCDLYPNCSSHSIRKRSTCEPGQFSCRNGGCIPGIYFCDDYCHCGDCSDRPKGCVRYCHEFRCKETFRCIALNKKCNGIDDCEDGSDEDGCPATTPSYTYVNCSMAAGDFFCRNNRCIGLEQVCNGYNDCGDWSDEGDQCNGQRCSPECSRKGGVCFTEPKGSKCLYECPPGTYETSEGCSRNPDAPLPTLHQVLEDTPRLITRYATRLNFLKTKIIMALSKSMREVAKCKKEEFTLLSKIIDFSTIIHEEAGIPRLGPEVDHASSGTSADVIGSNTETPPPSTEETVSVYPVIED